MVGVPRIIADALAGMWKDTGTAVPSSFDAIRTWVDGLSDTDWATAIPSGIDLTSEQCRNLWQTLRG